MLVLSSHHCDTLIQVSDDVLEGVRCLRVPSCLRCLLSLHFSSVVISRHARISACTMIIVYTICQVLFNTLAKLYILLPEIIWVQNPEVLLLFPSEASWVCHPPPWLPRDHTNSHHLPFTRLLWCDVLISCTLACLVIPGLNCKLFFVPCTIILHSFITAVFC